MADQKSLGYSDTPVLPGSVYRVHDGTRPQPRVVTPGTASTQEAAGKAPCDAVMLFDGSDISGWTGKDGAATWKVENGYMEVVPRSGNITSKAKFGDCQLHVEFAAPTVVKGDSQGRGNSGVFLLGLYEIQVLDCYQNPTYPDGTTAAIYGQYPPLVNACRAPGEWQTYDIIWGRPALRRRTPGQTRSRDGDSQWRGGPSRPGGPGADAAQDPGPVQAPPGGRSPGPPGSR